MDSREEHENERVKSRTGLRVLIAVMCALIAFISVGLYMWWTWEPPLFPEVDSIQEMTLISVDGTYYRGWRDEDGSAMRGEVFHQFPVIDKLQIDDPQDREGIMSAIQLGVDEGETPAECFYPRHGLRIITNETTIEYNICFECSHLEVYVDSIQVRKSTISQSP